MIHNRNNQRRRGNGGGGGCCTVTEVTMLRMLVLLAIGFVAVQNFIPPEPDFRLPPPSVLSSPTCYTAQQQARRTMSQQQQHPTTFFDNIVASTYESAVSKNNFLKQNYTNEVEPIRNNFVLRRWKNRTDGGLIDYDRVLLGKIYQQANSVFEYGLGESTYIAKEVGVPRYAGIDSDAQWVLNVRQSAPSHFRFYFADIGHTTIWGRPLETFPKQIFDYQVAPLLAEQYPFDVYMVDGRWRLACALISFLHANATGGDPTRTVVLIHDCPRDRHKTKDDRPEYRNADDLLDMKKHSGERLCVYQRKHTTSDKDLYERWLEVRNVIR